MKQLMYNQCQWFSSKHHTRCDYQFSLSALRNMTFLWISIWSPWAWLDHHWGSPLLCISCSLWDAADNTDNTPNHVTYLKRKGKTHKTQLFTLYYRNTGEKKKRIESQHILEKPTYIQTRLALLQGYFERPHRWMAGFWRVFPYYNVQNLVNISPEV